MPTPQLDNRQLGTDTARLNLLTNGGFEIWQRGNGPFTQSSTFTTDRWAISLAGTDTISMSRDTTNVDVGSNAAAAVTFTLGSGAGGSALYVPSPFTDGPNLKSKTVSLSVRVRTSVANAVRVGLNDGTGYTYSAYHSGGGTYETLTLTKAIAGTATTLSTAIFFAANCTAYLDNAMLVVGSVPADYAPLHPADDLARCYRYYQILAFVSSQYASMGFSYSTTNGVGPLLWGVLKAVVPTVTASTGWSTGGPTGSPIAVTTISPGQIGQNGCNLAWNVASGLSGNGTTTPLYGNGTTPFITVEANP